MQIWEVLLLAVAMAMDAFAVSVCKGLALERVRFRHMLLVGVWFGGFQALMPAVGYFLGSTVADYIERFDHWVVFLLLGVIGVNMLREAFSKHEECDCETDASLSPLSMLPLALATSIDALAVGVGFPGLLSGIPQMLAVVGTVGVVTLVLSGVGVRVGAAFGTRFKSKAEACGGCILIFLGVKFLLEGLGVLGA